MEASPILREIGEKEGQSDRPGQEKKVSTWLSVEDGAGEMAQMEV